MVRIETSTESRGFLLLTTVASAAGLGLTITNAVYYSRARNNCSSISNNAANVMMWLNIILAVILGIIFIVSLYRLVVHPDLRKELSRQSSEYLAGKPQGPVTSDRVKSFTTTISPSGTTTVASPGTTVTHSINAEAGGDI